MERKVERVRFHNVPCLNLKRVAAYARVSSGKDAMLHSLSAQVSYYSDLIQRHGGWQYCGVFADEALTGTKDTREQFIQLLDECRAGNIDIILTKSISRFARNTVTLLETVRELKSLGVDVYFEEQNIHTMSADGELMLTILASYAQEESLSASENQKWRVRKGFENGELLNWRFMYGYRIRKGKIEIDPHQAEIVREVFRRAVDGESFGSISRDMEHRGVPRVFGGAWSELRVRDMLANEKYVGNSLLQKKYRNNHLEKKLRRNCGELPRYYAKGTHPAIVELELFEEAQELLKRIDAETSGRKPQTRSVFTGLIRCPKCGGNYKRVTSNSSVGWNCATYQRLGKSHCFGKKIPDDTLRQVTADALGLSAFEPDAVSALIHHIEVLEPNRLIYILKDGRVVEREWHDRTRRDSWTDEMKQAARERAIQQRRKS